MCLSFITNKDDPLVTIYGILEQIAITENRGTTMIFRHTITEINNLYRSGVSSLYALDETFRPFHFSFIFPFYSPFIERFDEKTIELHSNGLIEHWTKNFMNPKGIINKSENIGPQVLTLDHLEVCFLIILLPLILAFIAFAGEILHARFFKK